MKKYIFVDLDETLIHANYSGTGDPRKAMARSQYEFIKLDDEWYKALLRPSASAILELCRSKGYKVCMLTMAIESYAREWNKTYNFGFKDDEIYAREDLYSGSLMLSHFPDGKTYLIDNLVKETNTIKLNFLRPISEKGITNYYRITDFYGREDPEIAKKELAEISEFLNQ